MLKRIAGKSIITALILLSGTVSFAQKKYQLKVKDAVEMALTNLSDVKNASIDVEIQQAQNREITGQALPQITGSASLSHYLLLPKILFPQSQQGIYDVLIKENLLPAILFSIPDLLFIVS